MKHPAWKSNHKTASESKATPTIDDPANKTQDSEETSLELSAWKDWAADGVKQLWEKPVPTVLKLVVKGVVSFINCFIWIVFQPLKGVVFIKIHTAIAYNTTCSTVANMMDVAANATVTMVDKIGQHVDEAYTVVFDPVHRELVEMHTITALVLCAIFFCSEGAGACFGSACQCQSGPRLYGGSCASCRPFAFLPITWPSRTWSIWMEQYRTKSE